MHTLIKDIIEDASVNEVLEANGFKYIGQLLVIHEHCLMTYPRMSREVINTITWALYNNRYDCIGSRQAHELPAVVLRHMADLAEEQQHDDN